MRTPLGLMCACLLTAACSDNPTDTPADAAVDTPRDVSVEAAADAPVDAPAESAADASVAACAVTPTDAGRPWPTFERHTLSAAFLSEGVGVADLNNDGRPDIVTVPYWYSGPDFARHEVATPPTPALDPARQFGSVYGVYPQDIDHDGCTDILVAPHEVDTTMFWYQNPRGTDGRCGADTHWPAHNILRPTWQAGTANPIVARLFADGPPVLVMSESTGGVLAWWRPGADPMAPWEPQPISTPAFAGAAALFHGVGVGDVNGDGRPDVLHPTAWFEQTSDPARWVQHPFGRALLNTVDVTRTCSRMFALDVDCDGLADVLCSRPHDYGLYWWQQQRASGAAEPTFVARAIDTTLLSQMHSLRLDDLDGDGVPEIITGKRFFAHLPPGDPGQFAPSLLVAWSMIRGASGVRFEPHVIDDDSGAGAQFEVTDLNGDGRPDIVVSNKKGLYYFIQRAP